MAEAGWYVKEEVYTEDDARSRRDHQEDPPNGSRYISNQSGNWQIRFALAAANHVCTGSRGSGSWLPLFGSIGFLIDQLLQSLFKSFFLCFFHWFRHLGQLVSIQKWSISPISASICRIACAPPRRGKLCLRAIACFLDVLDLDEISSFLDWERHYVSILRSSRLTDRTRIGLLRLGPRKVIVEKGGGCGPC